MRLFGSAPDVPIVEDYDGESDVAVWRPSNGVWYILRSGSGRLRDTAFGSRGDKPQPADYDCDGKANLVVYRPSDGDCQLWYSGTDTQEYIHWVTSTGRSLRSTAFRSKIELSGE